LFYDLFVLASNLY